MQLPPVRRTAVIAAFALSIFILAFLVRPTLVYAQSQTVYPPNADSRSFSAGAGGWTGATGSEGICLPPLVCPSVTNGYETGGAGDGYLRTTLNGVVGVQPVTGMVYSTWTSPTFTYDGVGGSRAGSLSFEMDRRADVAQLLALTGTSATFQVQLLDMSASGTGQTIVAPTSLADTTTWTPLGDVAVAPGALTMGHSYAIRIITSYGTGAGAVPTATADYDNVSLIASAAGSGSGSGNGNGDGSGSGSGSGGGGNGSNQVTSDQLRDMITATAPKSASVVSGGRSGHAKILRVKVKCPKKVKKACTIMARAQLSKKGKPITTVGRAHLKAGKSKVLRLLVKPRYKKAVTRSKAIFIRQQTAVGKVHVTTYQKRVLHKAKKR